MGHDLNPLICSWKICESKGKRQTYARIQLSDDPAMNNILYQKEGSDLRSYGEVLDFPLKPRTRYYYQIAVTSDAEETVVSEPDWFETGKMDEPWLGQWIGIDQPDPFHPEFFKTIEIAKPVKQARLYICGLGLFEAYMNGKKIGNDLFAPFVNDFEECVQSCTYDVEGLHMGTNHFAVILGNGWYRGRFGLHKSGNRDVDMALMAELHVCYEDGTEECIATDTSWQYRGSIYTLSDIYDGETQDYLLWEGKENPWRQAVPARVDVPLVDRYSLPLHQMEALPVKEVIHTPAGEIVLDMGQNFTGYVECTQVIPKGQTMVLQFGEILQNGNFYNDNYRTAKSTFTYVSDGAERTIRVHFTFFGFRYVKVSGLDTVDPGCFVGRAVYSEMERTGFIHTGNEKINQLFSNSLWGLKSNFLDMPTDCPQRDERLAWAGDAQVFCPTASFHMDTRTFFAKYLRDLRSDQIRNDGRVSVILPNTDEDLKKLTASIWGDVAAFMPSVMYLYFGSKEMLQKHYPLMKAWVDCIYNIDLKRGQKFLFDFGFQYGDWLALDGITERNVHGGTDTDYISSMYYYASTNYVAKAAEILNLPDAAEYRIRAEQIKQAVLDNYFSVTGRLAVETQTAYLIALKFGVYRNKQMLIKGLRNRIEQDGRRIRGGFVGATMMNTVLAENDLGDLAYDFLFYEGFPGWLYAINLGATTIWERWNSVLPDGSISGTDMNSLNHYAYGSVVEFLYRDAAGIRPVEPAFRKVRIEPMPEIRLGAMKCTYESVSGKYVSNWEICEDGSVKYYLEIPFGCEAEVCLPEQEMKVLGTGCYEFHLYTKRDYRALYTAETPLERLIQDPRAVEILDRNIPGLLKDFTIVSDPKRKIADVLADPQYATKDVLTTSLAMVMRMTLERDYREDAYHQAIAELTKLH